MSIEIIKSVSAPTVVKQHRVVRRAMVPDLRFGKVAILTDSDVDG